LSVAPTIGGRTLRACSMPGTFTSTAHRCVPSTLAGMSSRRGDFPTFFMSCTALSGALPVVVSVFFPVSVTLNFLPPMSSP
jgi:hypothetical protein